MRDDRKREEVADGLRKLYEQTAREPVPADMLASLAKLGQSKGG